MSEFALSFERDVPISANALYRCYTEAELLVKWFTPKPWVTKFALIEPWAGGAFETVMESPEGQEMPKGRGCVLLAEPGRKFVWTSTMRAGFIPNETAEGGWLMTAELEFIPQDNGAIYRATVHHANASARDQHAQMGFETGWGAALAQLVELMEGK